MDKLSYDGPVVLAVLDGVGLAPDAPGNAVSRARTPFLGRAAQGYLHVALDASGEAVGLLPGQMGNSEVGHNMTEQLHFTLFHLTGNEEEKY